MIWWSDAPEVQPLSGNLRPDLLTSLVEMSLILRLPLEMHLCRSYSNVPRLPSFLPLLRNINVLLTFGKVKLKKVVRDRTYLQYIFDLGMCFAPLQPALFQPRNFQNWCEHVVLLPFWLGTVLRATALSTFWRTQLWKVLLTRGFSLSLSPSPSLAVRSPCPSCARKREISNYKWRVHEITAGCCRHLYNHAGTHCIESPLD